MDWVAPNLTDGLGNRLFQMAAALGAAEKWNTKPVFFTPRIAPSVHSDCSVVYQLFSNYNLPKVELANSWKQHVEPPYECWKYTQLPSQAPGNQTVLQGYFQSEKYFPSKGIELNFEAAIPKDKVATYKSSMNFEDTWFLHLRLGDFLILPQYDINIKDYLQRVFTQIQEKRQGQKKIKMLVFSDSIDKATELLSKLPTPGIELLIVKDLNAVETLYLMSLCGGGGICSNSTFSWWGAYSSLAKKKGNPIYVPSRWILYNVPQEDVYSSWMTRI